MSLLGIDVGTSAVKVGVYREDGLPLAAARETVAAHRPRPGRWELDAERVWDAIRRTLSRIAAAPELRGDPPRALAIAASGREVFPVDAGGTPLDPCILAGDLRGADVEAETAARLSPTAWYRACGHQPERMDPTNRLLWWRRHRPDVTARARRFLGWHEFATLRLAGTAVTDRSLAGKWLVYDLATRDWSSERLTAFDIERELLPEVAPSGTVVGRIVPAIAGELGLPADLLIGVGGFDTSCAALGCGAAERGIVGLSCGTWESFVAPSDDLTPTAGLIAAGMSLGPHPGITPHAVFSLSPNGSAVTSWCAELVNLPLERLDAELRCRAGPSPVLAVPHLSGTTDPRAGSRDSRGAVLGMTLATTAVDLIQAFMEGIAYDLVAALGVLRAGGLPVRVVRATGGGSRSAWWMQLKADLTGVPVEVVSHSEPGTLGAALLAGVAARVYASIGEAAQAIQHDLTRHDPDERRNRAHHERLAIYREVLASVLPTTRRIVSTPEPGAETTPPRDVDTV
jgi:xylulokinase